MHGEKKFVTFSVGTVIDHDFIVEDSVYANIGLFMNIKAHIESLILIKGVGLIVLG